MAKDNVKLKYIFETHFHADFVSGHVDLSKNRALLLFMDTTAAPEFEAIVAEDNQVFRNWKNKNQKFFTLQVTPWKVLLIY